MFIAGKKPEEKLGLKQGKKEEATDKECPQEVRTSESTAQRW